MPNAKTGYCVVYGSESHLVDLTREELLDKLTAIGRLKNRFPVFNSIASLAELARFLRGERQHVPCVGGYKYFYLDWNLDISCCEAWSEPRGSVFDFDRIPDQRDVCNACMMACYRNASMLMHAGIAATDATRAFAAGDVASAIDIPAWRGAIALGFDSAAPISNGDPAMENPSCHALRVRCRKRRDRQRRGGDGGHR